jgi:V8-like Glu-specific endopeptidase
VQDPQVFPWCAVGKLFFKFENELYTGSAFVVADNWLMTAAHNLLDPPETPATDIQFIPAYTGGAAPFGTWEYRSFALADAWEGVFTSAYDVGLIRLDVGGTTNNPVGEITGVLNIAVDRPGPGSSWIAVGYPRSIDNTEYMIADPGDFSALISDGKVITKTGELVSDAYGVSGGPWLLQDANDTANGVFSGGGDGMCLSPYFAGWVQQFIAEHV